MTQQRYCTATKVLLLKTSRTVRALQGSSKTRERFLRRRKPVKSHCKANRRKRDISGDALTSTLEGVRPRWQYSGTREQHFNAHFNKVPVIYD